MPIISPIGIFTTDVNLNITSWNDWLVKFTGLSEESVKGTPVTRVIPDIEKKGLYERFLRVLTDGNVEILSSVFHHYLLRIPLQPPVGKFTEMQQRVTIAPLTEVEIIHGTIVTIEDVTGQLVNLPDQSSIQAGIEALSSEDWRTRRDIASGLSAAGKNIISEVLRKIKDEHRNLSVLNSAMKVLSMSETDVSEYLIEFLNDDDHELRIYAAQMLGEKNTPAIIEALIESLNDIDTNVKFHAIESLGKLKAFQAVERLAEIALLRDFFVSFPAIDALRAIGDSRAARLIYPLMEDEILGQPVLEALAELGEVEVVPYMVNQINKKSAFLSTVVTSLERIALRYQETLGDRTYIAEVASKHFDREGINNMLEYLELASEDELNSFITILGWIDDFEISKALTRFLGHPGTRKKVIDAMVASGQKVVDLLISQLEGELDIRQAAVMALGRIGGNRAVDALIPRLTEDDLAIICCGALAKIGSRIAFTPLLKLLGHGNPSIRRAAIAALNSIGHPDMQRHICKLLSDNDPLIRESALHIAGYFGYPDCQPMIHKLCSDTDLIVRIAAIENLPFYEDDRLLAALKNFYLDNNPKIRAAVVRALGLMENKQAYSLLISATDDADGWVRYYAIKSIDMLGYSEAMPKLKTIALNDPIPFVRLAAIEYMGHTGGPLSASILASLTGESDRDISLAAVTALGDIHHPDSLPPLLALTKSADHSVKILAIEALGRRGGSGTSGALQWIALTDKDTQIKHAAINGLRTISSKEAVNALLNLTTDTEHREKVISALASLPSELMDVLYEGLNHRHAIVRTAVVETLLRIHSPFASAKLAECLNHNDVKVRLATVYALHRLGNRSYMKQLIEVKNTDPDPVVRKAIEDILQNGFPE